MLYPSFAINVQAADYGDAQYGDAYSSGSHVPYNSNLSDQAIECIDNNVNINGIDINKLPTRNNGDLINELEASESENGEPQGNEREDRLNVDKNLVNICVNISINEQDSLLRPLSGGNHTKLW